jgi:hypothetical protein
MKSAVSRSLRQMLAQGNDGCLCVPKIVDVKVRQTDAAGSYRIFQGQRRKIMALIPLKALAMGAHSRGGRYDEL